MATKHTKETFIQKANEIHGDKYTYELVEYTNSQTKVIVTCPSHGNFNMKPNSHLSGQGCPHCYNLLRGKSRQARAKSSFIAKANIVHGDKYDYSETVYVSNRDKVTIGCPIHGNFDMRPNEHLRGKGCRLCGINNRTSDTQEFITKAQEVHGDKYTYEHTIYTYSKDKVKIGCPIHGVFETRASTHLKGSDCPQCAASLNIGWTRTGFKQKCDKNNNGLGILYVLECFNETEHFFKIGITSRSVQKRYKDKTAMPYNYRVIDEIVGDPEFIFDLETQLHKLHKQHQYLPIISFDGSLTECFSKYKENKI
jgi:hypothetical protein